MSTTDYANDVYLVAFALREEKPEAAQMLYDAAEYIVFLETSLMDELLELKEQLTLSHMGVTSES